MADVDDLIGEIYEAVGDAGRWQRLVERLAARAPLPRDIEAHLETARRAHDEHTGLSQAVDAATSVYDQLALGAAIVNGDGQLLQANTMARRLLDAGEGLKLENGYVRATDAGINAHLQDALRRVTSPHGTQRDQEAPLVVGQHGQEPISVTFLPHASSSPRFFEGERCATMLIVGPDRPGMPRLAVLQDLYGFTAREAEFASLLMRGLSVKDVAVSMRVATATARTFLAHVTAKTDSHSQAELMLRLSAIPRIQDGT